MNPNLERIIKYRNENRKSTSTSHTMTPKEFHEVYFELLEFFKNDNFDVKHHISIPNTVEIRIYNF